MLSTRGLKYPKYKKIAILGFGREGLSTLKFLKKHGFKPEILDKELNKKYLQKIKDYEVIFRTPGFPRLHPKLIAAEKKGTEISSHIKLFFDLCPAKIIGITGTKGKTTTASLIYEILKTKFGKKVFLAGNIGKPALDILTKLDKNSLVVLELSSFQLQDLHKSPHVAVITNVTSDHLDPTGKFAPNTHQSQKEYSSAKMNIIRHQKSDSFAVIHKTLKKRTKNLGQGKKIYPALKTYKTKLLGRHNLENIALAAAVGKIFKVNPKSISKTVTNFKPIEHRLEFVRSVDGVSFYNDSIATNPDATLAALKSFDQPVGLILGGSDKGLDYRKLAKYILRSKNVKAVAVIGQIKEKLHKLIGPKKSRKFKSLKDALLTLNKEAVKNDVVLLSPAAASFDMFKNYDDRGKQFKKLVRKLEVAHGR